jgi:hypothetical protein
VRAVLKHQSTGEYKGKVALAVNVMTAYAMIPLVRRAISSYSPV